MSDVSKTNGAIARLTVQRGDLTEYPLAEKVRGGWQNGVTFYPDGEVTKVQELTVALATRAHVPGELNDVRDEFPETVAFIRENADALAVFAEPDPYDDFCPTCDAPNPGHTETCAVPFRSTNAALDGAPEPEVKL